MTKYNISEPIKYGESIISEVFKIQDVDNQDIYVLKRIKGLDFPLNQILFNRGVEALRKLTNCKDGGGRTRFGSLFVGSRLLMFNV